MTSNPEDGARRDESQKSKDDTMYVCIVITFIIIRGRQTNVKIHIVPRSTCVRYTSVCLVIFSVSEAVIMF